ncbi:hypothetical protein ACSFBX_31410 [Variovorax sp. RB2P76]|uniref:hypothetical protein n=1 Tax=Variovorax sp. RB2P76 TaxID=3443736 RepID=UPI003F468366
MAVALNPPPLPRGKLRATAENHRAGQRRQSRPGSRIRPAIAGRRAFAPQLAEGAIVNALSILAKVTVLSTGSLFASKAAALRMTEGVPAELAAQRMRVPGGHDWRDRH